MTGQESLWSAMEVRTQAEQVRGQLDVWDVLDQCPGIVRGPRGEDSCGCVLPAGHDGPHRCACGVS